MNDELSATKQTSKKWCALAKHCDSEKYHAKHKEKEMRKENDALRKELNALAQTKNQETSIIINEIESQTNVNRNLTLQLNSTLTLKIIRNNRNGRAWPE